MRKTNVGFEIKLPKKGEGRKVLIAMFEKGSNIWFKFIERILIIGALYYISSASANPVLWMIYWVSVLALIVPLISTYILDDLVFELWGLKQVSAIFLLLSVILPVLFSIFVLIPYVVHVIGAYK
jgi:hypothetical protein